MGASRIIILSVSALGALALALIAAAFMHRPVRAPSLVAAANAEPAPQTVQVLVAKRDLSVGTRLVAGDLGWQPWPMGAVNPAFITGGRVDNTPAATPTAAVVKQAGQMAAAAATVVAGDGPMQALYGAMVRQSILTNEPITNGKLLRNGEGGFLAVTLAPGMRAVSVPVTVSTSAGGFILPGDHVDVLQAHQADAAANGGHSGFVAQTLLRNLRVLAIDQTSQPQKGAESLVGAVATLEVPEDKAKVMAMAKAQGEVVLALRPFAEANNELAGSGVGAEETGSVRIIRAGQASDVMVAQ